MADLDISISTEKSQEEIDKLKKSVNILVDDLEILDKSLITNSKNFKEAAGGAKAFKDSLGGVSGKTGAVGGATTSINNQAKKLDVLSNRYEKISKSVVDFSNANKNLDVQLGKTTGSIDQQRNAFRRSAGYSKSATLNLKQLGTASGAAELALTGLVGATAAFAAIGIGKAVIGISNALLEVELASDRAKRQISILTGDMKSANVEFDYAVKVSKDLGLNFMAVTKEYAKFLAASKSSTLSTSQLRDTFVSFSKALAATQASSQDTELVFLALNQMISKGRVSSEELRRQLSERLPGAFQIAAKSLGLTVAQLDEALKTGALLTDDFLPAFSKGIEETFGPQAAQSAIEGTQASLNRLSNSWNEFKLEVMDGQVKEGFSWILDTFSDAVDYAKEMVKATKGILDFSKYAPSGKGFGRFAGDSRELDNLRSTFSRIMEKQHAFDAAKEDVIRVPSTDQYFMDFKALRDKIGQELLIMQKEFKNTFGIDFNQFYKEVYGESINSIRKYNYELTEQQKIARDKITKMGKLNKDIQKAIGYAKTAIPGEDLRSKKGVVSDVLEKAVAAQKKALDFFEANKISDVLISDLDKYAAKMKMSAPEKALLQVDTSKLTAAIDYLNKAESDALDKQAKKIAQNIDLRSQGIKKATQEVEAMGLEEEQKKAVILHLEQRHAGEVDTLIKKNLSRLDLLKIELEKMQNVNVAEEKRSLLNKAILDTQKDIANVAKSNAEIFVNGLREQGKTYKEIRQEAQAALEISQIQKETFDAMGDVINTKVKKEIIAFKRQYGLAKAEIDPIVDRIKEWAATGEITNQEMEMYIELAEGKAVKATEKLSESYKEFNNLVSTSITNINDGVADAILGLDKNFSDVLDNMAKAWAKFALQTAVIQPILGDPTKGADPTNGIIGAIFSGIRGDSGTTPSMENMPSTFDDFESFNSYLDSIPATSPMVSQPKVSTSVQVNNYSQSKVEAQPTVDANGNMQLRIMVRDEMKAAVLDGSLDKSASSAWGVQRVGVK